MPKTFLMSLSTSWVIDLSNHSHYDDTFVSSRRELDRFRQKFNFLYLCKACARSFDSMNPVGKCKFCSAEGPEILDMKVPGKTIYRYYCPKCEKNRISESIVEACIKCGSKFVHVYRWGNKSRHELARHRARSLLASAKSTAFSIRSGLRNAVKSND
jgi:ribosomal protein L37AE/L43A